jgi:hypothetical protein
MNVSVACQTRQSTALRIAAQGNILRRTFIRPQIVCNSFELIAEAAVFWFLEKCREVIYAHVNVMMVVDMRASDAAHLPMVTGSVMALSSEPSTFSFICSR